VVIWGDICNFPLFLANPIFALFHLENLHETE